ncbi:MAG: LysM peptidoglycan-binding domain-containing protein, partial [Longimicrobiales bacterium]
DVPAEAAPAVAPDQRRPPGRGPALLGVTAEQAAGPVAQDTTRRHRVRRGDTLWDLAAAYLGNPFLWPRIFDVNRDVVENPHWIYPAEWLLIPGLVDELAGQARPPEQAADVGPEVAMPVERPELRQVEPEPEPERAIEEEDLPAPVTEAQFRSAPWLANPGALQPKGEFVRILDPGTATGAEPSARPVRPHDLIYLRYEDGARPEVGEELLLVRVEEEEDRYEGYGRVITPTALVRVVSLTRDVMTGEVVHQFGKVNPGDLLLPTVPAPDLGGMHAEPVGDGPRGMLMGFVMAHPLHSVTDVGFIDLGRVQGLDVGDELVVYLPGREVGATEDALPAEPIATLRVIRTTERTSTVMVTAVSQPVLQPGLPVRVFRKIR